jgi:hypothetical protein
MILCLSRPYQKLEQAILLGGKGRPAHKADNLTAIYEAAVYKNTRTSVFHNPMGLCDLL